jgi:molybdenum cofactor guanylyltransferase
MPADIRPSALADVTGAILAGGQGSRVGGLDKGMMPILAEPLVAQVVRSLRRQVGRILICANRHVAEYSAYGEVVTDRIGGFRGPLAGIDSALAACRTPWLLTVPVDCPRPPENLAQRLRDAAESANAKGATVRTREQREPLFAIYRTAAIGSLDDALERDLPVWRWQDELGIVELEYEGSSADFDNLNTGADFRRWEKLLG